MGENHGGRSGAGGEVRPTKRRLRLPAVLVALAMLGAMVVTLPSASALKSAKRLESARVPALCGHPAGNLVDGSLPGIAANEGYVSLDTSLVALGRIKGKKTGAAAVVRCSAGGVGWPDNIVFYSAKGKLIGKRQLFKVTGGDRDRVEKIWIEGRTVHVKVTNITRNGDASCCGSATAKLEFRWSAKKNKIVMTKKKIYTERKTANKAVRAMNEGSRTKLLKYATPSAADQLLGFGTGWEVTGCDGPLNPLAFDRFTERTCFLWTIEPSFQMIQLKMARTGFKKWQVVDVRWESTN